MPQEQLNATEQVLAAVHDMDAHRLRFLLRREGDRGGALALAAAANARDALGFSALYHALVYLDELSFAALLEAGADPFASAPAGTMYV